MFALEREQYERRISDEKARAQPKFAYHTGSGNGGVEQTLEFRNVGQIARSLSIEPVDTKWGGTVQIEPPDWLETNRGGKIHIRGLSNYPALFRLKYVDQFNDPGEVLVQVYEYMKFRTVPTK